MGVVNYKFNENSNLYKCNLSGIVIEVINIVGRKVIYNVEGLSDRCMDLEMGFGRFNATFAKLAN